MNIIYCINKFSLSAIKIHHQVLRSFNFEPNCKLQWHRARDMFGLEIPVSLESFELRISYIRNIYLTRKGLCLIGLCNYFLCNRFSVQKLFWSLEFSIQKCIKHDILLTSSFLFIVLYLHLFLSTSSKFSPHVILFCGHYSCICPIYHLIRPVFLICLHSPEVLLSSSCARLILISF